MAEKYYLIRSARACPARRSAHWAALQGALLTLPTCNALCLVCRPVMRSAYCRPARCSAYGAAPQGALLTRDDARYERGAVHYCTGLQHVLDFCFFRLTRLVKHRINHCIAGILVPFNHCCSCSVLCYLGHRVVSLFFFCLSKSIFR